MATPRFKIINKTQEQEDAFDYVKARQGGKKTGFIGTVAHMVKSALGGGILGAHVAYMKGGVMVGVPVNIIFGIYMTYCLSLLLSSAQKLYRRTEIPTMSYPDIGEAAVYLFPNPKVARFSKPFRYAIDTLICTELFGACACYQIIIAKSIKQLVEDTHQTSLSGHGGYPGLRVYMAIMIIPIILICMITHLKWLAPFSIVANGVIFLSICMAVYYAFLYNPSFSDLVPYTSLYHVFELVGVSVFSMSCAGVVVPIENNMKQPQYFHIALAIGMTLIIFCTFSVAFFGYVAFLDKCESPITVNFPMELVPKIFKGLVALMIYITHALNFWAPFNLVFVYLKKRHPPTATHWEYVYRALLVVIISVVAIIFPNINALMGFLGTFCLSNMAFIWPNIITLLVIWERPGLGKFKWRLWRFIILTSIGLFIFLGAFCISNMALIWPNIITLLVIWERPGLGKFKWRLWRFIILTSIGFFVFLCGSAVNLIELMSSNK